MDTRSSRMNSTINEAVMLAGVSIGGITLGGVMSVATGDMSLEGFKAVLGFDVLILIIALAVLSVPAIRSALRTRANYSVQD